MTDTEARHIVALSQALRLLDAVLLVGGSRKELNDIVALLGDDFNKGLVRRAEEAMERHDDENEVREHEDKIEYETGVEAYKDEIVARLADGDKDFYSRKEDFEHIVDDEPFHRLQTEGRIMWNYDTLELELGGGR